MDYTHDALGRITQISEDGTPLLQTLYAGRRPVQQTYGNGVQVDLTYDGISNQPGDFGVKQVVRQTAHPDDS